MILQLLHLLFISLGFNDQPKPARLNRQPQYKILNLKNPILVIILSVIAMILFTLIFFLFMPGTESGVVYNNSWA